MATTHDAAAFALSERYTIERELGRGGMAVVYLAHDRVRGGPVALKVLHTDVSVALGTERFRREIEIASQLSHSNILAVLDAGEIQGQLYFTMPVVTGESLADRLRRERQVPVDDAVRIAQEVAAGLAYAHACGLIHRDIKPENILLQDGQALVADFGIARATADPDTAGKLTRTGVTLGTPAYMSPEQAAAERGLDGRTDQYALGCVLYEMLAGVPPYVAPNAHALMARHALEPVPSVRIIRDTVPEQVEDALHRALAKSPVDRFPNVTQFSAALGSAATWTYERSPRATRGTAGRRIRRVPRWLRGRRGLGALAAVLALAGSGTAAWRIRQQSAMSADLITIAVAPFDPLQPTLNLWQEGLVDLMSRKLDGAGPLRAVAPAMVVRGWGGRADRNAARTLAERTGARYALYGSVGAAGGGAVRLAANLLNPVTDSLEQREWTGLEVARLADSLTLWVLEEMRQRHTIGAVRERPTEVASIEALKLFLQGEQHYRRTAWVPALAAYERAAALDTAFALPYRRMSQIAAWQRDGLRNSSDSLSRVYALRAGAVSRGLAPRDSLLVLSDSLMAALSSATPDVADWRTVQRLMRTVDDAARRYPNDPEVWFQVGEARQHHGYGTYADVTEEEVLAAFDRAIALDPGFAPAYVHAVELGFTLRGASAGRRYAAAYLALHPTDAEADGIRLVERVTDPARARSAETARLLDTLPTSVIANAVYALRRWPDSTETALSLVRAIERRPRTASSHAKDSALVRSFVPLQLAYRGRLSEAWLALAGNRAKVAGELLLLSGIERDSAGVIFGRWLSEGTPQARLALGWWAQSRDTTSLARFGRRADSLARAGPAAGRRLATHDAIAAQAYAALARRDTAEAVAHFARLSDTLCLGCYVDRLAAARLLAARGQLAEADRLLRQRLYTVMTPVEVWIAVERGRVALRQGDLDIAARAFRLVAGAWSRADPEVQPLVREARDQLRAAGTTGDVVAKR